MRNYGTSDGVPEKRVADLTDELTAVDGLVERRCRTWVMQPPVERRRRMHYVLLLSQTLADVRRETTFGTTWAEWAIEAVITGELDDLRLFGISMMSETELMRTVGNAEHAVYYASIFARFREVCEEAYTTALQASAS